MFDFDPEKSSANTSKQATAAPSRGRTLIEHMRGKGTVSLSTDEILRLTRDATR